MKDIAIRDIAVLLICVGLIAGGAVFWFNRQSSNQDSVALEPIQAVPMRVPNASDRNPPPPATVRTPDPIKPRAVTPTAPASSAATPSNTSSSATSSSSTSSSSASSSDPSPSATTASDATSPDTTSPDTTVPEPSERPSDATTPSDATLPSPSSDPAADASTASAIIAAATPSALPVRNSAQGWAVQAGAFKNASNAITLRDRLLKLGLAARVETAADGVNRVLVGAYASAASARAASVSVAAALK